LTESGVVDILNLMLFKFWSIGWNE